MSNMLTLAPGERVLLQVRRHWYVLFAQVVVLAVPFVAPFFALGFFEGSLEAQVPGVQAYTLFAMASWYLIVWMIFFNIWTNYYLDVWILTDRRIIDIQQYSLFSRKISECRLDRVQDVSTEVHGLLSTLLHFGNVSVQTAAESEKFIMPGVPDPYGVKDAIIKAQDELLRKLHAGVDGHVPPGGGTEVR